MSSRFQAGAHQRDARSQLFAGYDSRGSSQSPRPGLGAGAGTGAGAGNSRPASGYGYGYNSGPTSAPNGAFSAYPGGGGPAAQGPSFRSATPNSKGQYSETVLSELESQNDAELDGMSAKVKMLKNITLAIGDEIRDSTTLAEKMNDSFDSTRVRLRGTMNRMLRMAEKTGVGWRVWVGFFMAVIFLFWYVWLF